MKIVVLFSDTYKSEIHLIVIYQCETADCTVNMDRAKEVGETILKFMVGNNVQEYTLKKKNHLVTMGQKKSIKVDGEPLQIDPQMLFQRLTTVARECRRTFSI